MLRGEDTGRLFLFARGKCWKKQPQCLQVGATAPRSEISNGSFALRRLFLREQRTEMSPSFVYMCADVLYLLCAQLRLEFCHARAQSGIGVRGI